jgi:hypothetical protein
MIEWGIEGIRWASKQSQLTPHCKDQINQIMMRIDSHNRKDTHNNNKFVLDCVSAFASRQKSQAVLILRESPERNRSSYFRHAYEINWWSWISREICIWSIAVILCRFLRANLVGSGDW